MAKFLYRGKKPEELKEMETKEFSKFLNSRERRKLRRGLTMVEKKLMKKIRKNAGKDAFIRTRARDMIVMPEMVGVKLGIYNGQNYETVVIKEDMVGHRLGEFAQTRKKVKHSSPGLGATRSSKFVPLK